MTKTKGAPFRLAPGLDLVSAVTLASPELDDPALFGRVAAAQVLSELYAQGADALFALALVGAPGLLSDRALQRMLEGAGATLEQAQVSNLGARDIHTSALAFGLSATGAVARKRRFSPDGGRAGDVLVLTKPIGTGIAAAAIQLGHASRAFQRAAVAQMTTLNRAAAGALAASAGVHAVADVQSRGLLGHAFELARGAKARVQLELGRTPILAGVPALAAEGVVPEATRRMLKAAGDRVRFPEGLPEDIALVLADGQLNGGLLAAVDAKQVGKLLRALEKAHVEGAVVGTLVKGKPGVDVLG